jgi:predicted lipid-binding transport protein (Tim44 family)
MRRKRLSNLILGVTVFFLAIGLSLTLASVVLARAGGGQDYVPSGGSDFGGGSSFDSSFDSSSSTGSSSGGGSWVGGLVVLVVIVVVAAAISAAARRARRSGRGGNIAGPGTGGGLTMYVGGVPINIGGGAGTGPGQAVSNIPAELARLQQKDPAFNEQVFKDQAQNAFYKIQEAWESQNLQIGRPYMTDQLMQRYATQISDIQSRGERNVLENMVLGHMTTVNIRTDNAYDYITLQMDASAADYTVDRNGKFLRGSKRPEHFTEYWTFLRKVSAKTNVQKSVKANVCPNCGAPLQLSATGQCQYCNAVVTSGEYDWVLSEITQAR